MQKTTEQLVREVAAKYRPNCPKWMDDVQDVLAELRAKNHQCSDHKLKDLILEEVGESFIAWGIPTKEFDIHVNEIFNIIPKREKLIF